ncbi:MAG: hypothetical protein MUP13_10110 [Thermoanaerobaculales bacterium]|nr:hypothetical protein [Thermoanaerobaculales bacterium]
MRRLTVMLLALLVLPCSVVAQSSADRVYTYDELMALPHTHPPSYTGTWYRSEAYDSTRRIVIYMTLSPEGGISASRISLVCQTADQSQSSQDGIREWCRDEWAGQSSGTWVVVARAGRTYFCTAADTSKVQSAVEKHCARATRLEELGQNVLVLRYENGDSLRYFLGPARD